MFDERSVNLTSNYAVFSQEDFHDALKVWNQAIVPLIEASLERLKYEWDKRAKIEIGDETYVLKPNESGGYSWAKIDPLTDLEWDFEEEEEPEEESSTPTASAQTPLSSTPVTLTQQPETSTPTNETTQAVELSRPKAPTQSQASSPPPPEHIDPNHWQELVEKSAIAPAIAQMNFLSLHFSQARGSHEAWDRLMVSESLPRTNTGRLSGEMLKTYSYLDSTDGWWCNAGVDPRTFESLNPGDCTFAYF